MRKAIMLLLAVPLLAFGQEAYIRDVTLDTNGVGAVTFDVRGVLDSIYLSGVTTANVAIAYSPRGGLADVTIATNVTAQTDVFRPVRQSTGANNAAVSGSYGKYVLAGETVTVTFGGVSNAAWRVVLKRE